MSELSKQYHSIFIGDKNTWDDWHIVPTSRPLINPPEVKKNYVEIPGSSGDLDYTEILTGAPVFKNRVGSWEFMVLNGYQNWHDLYDTLLNYFHGKEFDIILEDAPNFKYHGRLELNEWKSEEKNSKIVIDYTISPYKSRISTFMEDWKWDDLTFNTDSYIIMYGTFDVDGEKERDLYNPSENEVEISLTLTSPMTAFFYGTTYTFNSGYTEHTNIFLGPKDNYITFFGNGRAVVNYDKGESI